MKFFSYEELYDKLLNLETNCFEDSFELSKGCSQLLNNKETESKGRDIIIRVLDIWEKIHPATHCIWNDLIESAGLYPYINSSLLSGSAKIRHEYHKSKVLNGIYLHEEQMHLLIKLNQNKSVIVSAPTSFGKSLLIEELVASKKYDNIVIIQPTLALLDETRKKLRKYRQFYNIIVSTTQEPSPERNIFLFTGERVVEYKLFPKIDFFIIDEFYKLSMERDDERSTTLNHAFYRLLKMTKTFYLLGPNIKSIPEGFREQYGAEWHRTDFATVAVDVFNVSKSLEDKKKEENEELLFNLLLVLNEPTLIYCSSPDKVNTLSLKFLKYIKDKKNSETFFFANNDLIEWINENIHDKWDIKDAISYQIGVHHGALPRHLASTIVDLFNNGGIKYLFCTSTLIEGVNTSTKNVILYDKKKGPKLIDYFDYKNIVGRSGRMKRHFIGRVYQFHPQPKQIDIEVDIPIYTQTAKAPLELLIQIETQDLNQISKKRMEFLTSLSQDIQELLKKNSGIPVEGQLRLLAELENNFQDNYQYISWSGIPKYQQLQKVIELCWSFLIKKGESKGGVRTPGQLAYLTLSYCKLKSLKAVINNMANSDYWKGIESDNHKRLQIVISMVLQVTKHWFDYKLPKLLDVFSEIQSYVCRRKGRAPGNYLFLTKQLENNFLPTHLSLLLEFDIPVSAIRKLELLLLKSLTLDDMVRTLKNTDLSAWGLLPYELKKVNGILE